MTPGPRETGVRRDGRGRAALAGTAAVVLALAGGKWAAYLGVHSLFPIDVLLAAAAARAVLRRLLHPRGSGPAPRWWPGGALAAFTLYPAVVFAVGADHSMVALRDYAPYGYAVAAFLVAWSVGTAGPESQRRTVRLLDLALLFHLAWVGVVLLVPTLPARLPLINVAQQLHLFDIRFGSDGTVVGVTAALYLMRLLRDGRLRDAIILAVALVEVASMPARASLLSTAVAVLLTIWLCYSSTETSVHTHGRRLLFVGALPLCLLLTGMLMPHTPPGSKLLSSLGVAAVDSPVDRIGIGTAAARDQGWRLVLGYVADTDRRGLGVGFGPNYLVESGARRSLGDNAQLRQPHNFALGTYARLGLVGVGLLAGLVLAAAGAIVRLRQLAGRDDLLLLAAVLPPAFLVSGSVGVLIESPFGAVPFYWFLGILLARGRVASGERLAGTAGGQPRQDRSGGRGQPAGRVTAR